MAIHKSHIQSEIMPATTVIMLNIPSVELNFADIVLRKGEIMPATTDIMLNIPSVGLNFANIMLRKGEIMPDSGLCDHIFGILEPQCFQKN